MGSLNFLVNLTGNTFRKFTSLIDFNLNYSEKQFKFLESYVPFSRTFAPIASFSKKKAAYSDKSILGNYF